MTGKSGWTLEVCSNVIEIQTLNCKVIWASLAHNYVVINSTIAFQRLTEQWNLIDTLNWKFYRELKPDKFTFLWNVKIKVFRKQVSCNASVWKTYFVQFCVQRLRECYYFDLFYLELPLGNLSPNLWTKKPDFHYILLGF